MLRQSIALVSAIVIQFTVFSMAHGATIIPNAPQLNNKAYVLMDYETGQILASKNEQQKLAPASMTKMMTSYIIEQKLLNGELTEDEKVRMNETAWCRGKSSESCMFVPLDGTASVIDMLRGIIIQSGNDASKALAEHISGNEGIFVDLMNQEAKRLGMENTNFANSTGMPAQNHYSSAKDMAVLAQHIIRDSAKYYPLYAEKEFTYNGIKQTNRNNLLFSDPTVDGLKTGHTIEAGYCLTASSKRGSMRLVSVIFGAPTEEARTAQTKELFAWGFTNFDSINVKTGKETLTTAQVWFGTKNQVNIGLVEDFSIIVPKGEKPSITTEIVLQPELNAPIQQGQVVGKLITTMNDQQIAEKPLVALDAVEQAGFFSRLIDHIKQFFANLFG